MATKQCLTSADAAWVGLLAPGVACSGHGICTSEGLCVCDAGWSGRSDYFDLRIATMPNGTELSLDCSTADSTVVGAWAFFIVAAVFKAASALRALVVLCRRRGWGGSRGWRSAVRHPPYIVLTMDIATIAFFLIPTAVLKIATTQVLGTDVAVTLLLGTGVALQLSMEALLKVNLFSALAKARLRGAMQNADRLVRIFTTNQIGMWFFYFAMSVVPGFVMLGLDPSVGPIASHRDALLVLRNCGVAAWLTAQMLGLMWMYRELSTVLRTVKETAEMGVAQTRADTVSSVIAYLAKEQRKLSLTLAVSFSVYTAFSVPYLWPFITAPTAVVMGFASFSGANWGQALIGSAQAQDQASKDASGAVSPRAQQPLGHSSTTSGASSARFAQFLRSSGRGGVGQGPGSVTAVSTAPSTGPS